MQTRALRALAPAATAAVLLLTACSGSVSVSTGSSTIDKATAEKAITETITSKVGPEVPVTITCPEGVAMASGATFQCTGTVAGQPITILVTQKDADGNVSYESQEALIELAAAEKAISDDTSTKLGAKVTTTCPGPAGADWLVAKPGSTFECTVTDGTDTIIVVTTVKDAEGNITWKQKA